MAVTGKAGLAVVHADPMRGLAASGTDGLTLVHCRTLTQALEPAVSQDCKPRQGLSWRLEAFTPMLDATPEDTKALRNQRHAPVLSEALTPPAAAAH